MSTASATSLPANAAQINPADVLEEFVPLRIESRAAPPAQNTPLWDNGEFHLKVIDVAEENENGRSRKASKAK
jgi:hypothetical protein